MLLTPPPRKILDREIDTSFRKWLRFARMLEAPLLPAEKFTLALLNILGEVPREPERWFDAILEFYWCGEDLQDGESTKEKLLDWEKDGAAIWADFRIYAGIDLSRENLHWWEFMALFRSLPEDARICRLMALRGTDLSTIKDPETRNEYAKRKRLVTLEPESLQDWM